MGIIKQFPMHRSPSRTKNSSQIDNVLEFQKLGDFEGVNSVDQITIISIQKKQNFDCEYKVLMVAVLTSTLANNKPLAKQFEHIILLKAE